jgi:glucan phosphoethanolaminetransferase (alkaline phosphatase superfamily)
VTESTSAVRRPTWIVATIAGAFALLYAYAVWSAISQLVQSVQTTSSAGLSLNPLGWIVWLLAIALPIALFALAVSIGRTRGLRTLAILLLVGLSIVAVFWLDVVAYTTVNTSSLIG